MHSLWVKQCACCRNAQRSKIETPLSRSSLTHGVSPRRCSWYLGRGSPLLYRIALCFCRTFSILGPSLWPRTPLCYSIKNTSSYFQNNIGEIALILFEALVGYLLCVLMPGYQTANLFLNIRLMG